MGFFVGEIRFRWGEKESQKMSLLPLYVVCLEQDEKKDLSKKLNQKEVEMGTRTLIEEKKTNGSTTQILHDTSG